MWAYELKLVYHFIKQSPSIIEDRTNSEVNNIYLYIKKWLRNLSLDKKNYRT